MAGGTFFCCIDQDDHLSFTVPNLAWGFESRAPIPGPWPLLYPGITELEPEPEAEPLFALALLVV